MPIVQTSEEIVSFSYVKKIKSRKNDVNTTFKKV